MCPSDRNLRRSGIVRHRLLDRADDIYEIEKVLTFFSEQSGLKSCIGQIFDYPSCSLGGTVRYHCGGWPEEVNTCFLNSYMVYL